jgi:hypothetical protein
MPPVPPDQELSDPFRLPLALPDLEQRTNNVADHVRQEPIRDNTNLEHGRKLVATGSNSRPDFLAIAANDRPRGTPIRCRSPRPWNALAAARE